MALGSCIAACSPLGSRANRVKLCTTIVHNACTAVEWLLWLVTFETNVQRPPLRLGYAVAVAAAAAIIKITADWTPYQEKS